MSSTTTGARVCFTSRVRADRIPEYRAAHAAVWPEMLAALRDTGWRDYRLFLRPDGLLVGFLETDDYAAAQRAMAATEVNARWQAAMSGFFVDEGNPDDGFVLLDEVFHLEGQLAALSGANPTDAPQAGETQTGETQGDASGAATTEADVPGK